MKILVNFASRSRPEKFFKCLDNLREKSVGEYTVVGTFDLDDQAMNNDEVKNRFKEYPELIPIFGESKSKVDAINKNVNRIHDWDIVVNFSDDQLMVKQGWDDEIRRAFDKHGLDTIIHWPDNCPYRERLISMSIMGREYYDRFGYIYNPEYISLWCDNEAKDVAEILGCYRYMGGAQHDNILYHHIHPAHIKGLEYDDLLRKTESFYRVDEETYKRRKARNFDL